MMLIITVWISLSVLTQQFLCVKTNDSLVPNQTNFVNPDTTATDSETTHFSTSTFDATDTEIATGSSSETVSESHTFQCINCTEDTSSPSSTTKTFPTVSKITWNPVQVIKLETTESSELSTDAPVHADSSFPLQTTTEKHSITITPHYIPTTHSNGILDFHENELDSEVREMTSEKHVPVHSTVKTDSPSDLYIPSESSTKLSTHFSTVIDLIKDMDSETEQRTFESTPSLATTTENQAADTNVDVLKSATTDNISIDASTAVPLLEDTFPNTELDAEPRSFKDVNDTTPFNSLTSEPSREEDTSANSFEVNVTSKYKSHKQKLRNKIFSSVSPVLEITSTSSSSLDSSDEVVDVTTLVNNLPESSTASSVTYFQDISNPENSSESPQTIDKHNILIPDLKSEESILEESYFAPENTSISTDLSERDSLISSENYDAENLTLEGLGSQDISTSSAELSTDSTEVPSFRNKSRAIEDFSDKNILASETTTIPSSSPVLKDVFSSNSVTNEPNGSTSTVEATSGEITEDVDNFISKHVFEITDALQEDADSQNTNYDLSYSNTEIPSTSNGESMLDTEILPEALEESSPSILEISANNDSSTFHTETTVSEKEPRVELTTTSFVTSLNEDISADVNLISNSTHEDHFASTDLPKTTSVTFLETLRSQYGGNFSSNSVTNQDNTEPALETASEEIATKHQPENDILDKFFNLSSGVVLTSSEINANESASITPSSIEADTFSPTERLETSSSHPIDAFDPIENVSDSFSRNIKHLMDEELEKFSTEGEMSSASLGEMSSTSSTIEASKDGSSDISNEVTDAPSISTDDSTEGTAPRADINVPIGESSSTVNEIIPTVEEKTTSQTSFHSKEFSYSTTEPSSVNTLSTDTHREGKHIPFSTANDRDKTDDHSIGGVIIVTESTPYGTEKNTFEMYFKQRDYEELTTEEKANVLTAIIQLSSDFHKEDKINEKIADVHQWILHILQSGYENNTMSLFDEEEKQDHTAFKSPLEVIYISPTPEIHISNLTYTFYVYNNFTNETLPADFALQLLKSHCEELIPLTNASATHFYHGLQPQKNDFLTVIIEKYGTIVAATCLAALILVILLVCIVIYYRRKTRYSAHNLTNDKLHRNMQEAIGLDLNPAVVILQEELKEKVLNGNKICSLDDNEGWLVPFTDVPVAEEKDAPKVQDTKL